MTINPTPPEISASNPETILGHPKGLYTLVGTELWERLSFYGLQALIAYFIYYSVSEGGLGLSQAVALGITGAYGGAVYLLQPVGAWVADRLISPRNVVLVGGLIIMAGHTALAFVDSIETLLLGLGLIVSGTGLLTPSIYALVGALYRKRKNDTDGAFSIFYGGLLIGAFLGPVIMGFLQTRIGFHVAFSFAAIGMAIGLVVFIAGWRLLPDSASTVPNPIGRRARLVYFAAAVAAVLVLIALTTSSVINFENINTVVLLLVAITSIVCFAAILTSRSVSRTERRKVVGYLPVFIAGVVFEILFLSLFTTLAVYSDTRIDLNVGGFEVPPSYISSFEVLAGIAIVITLAAIWKRMGDTQPSSMMKLIGGLLAISASYVILAVLPFWYSEQISVWPVMLAMAIFALGEVVFTPLAMSLASQSAPRSHQAQMMAIYSLSMAAGASLSGYFAQFYTTENEVLFFGFTAAAGIICALLLLIFHRTTRNHGTRA